MIVYTCGIPRSGSTLVWNATKLILDNKPIKTHEYHKKYDKNIISYRHPYDICVSLVNCGACCNYNSAVRHFITSYNKFIQYKRDDKRNLFLKYENFWDNYEYLIESISDHLEIKISKLDKLKIIMQIRVDEAQKISDKFKKFSKYDKESLIHGNHINGIKPEQWKELDQDQLNELTKLNKYAKLMGYNDQI
jgi:hypothetical protein